MPELSVDPRFSFFFSPPQVYRAYRSGSLVFSSKPLTADMLASLSAETDAEEEEEVCCKGGEGSQRGLGHRRHFCVLRVTQGRANRRRPGAKRITSHFLWRAPQFLLADCRQRCDSTRPGRQQQRISRVAVVQGGVVQCRAGQDRTEARPPFLNEWQP